MSRSDQTAEFTSLRVHEDYVRRCLSRMIRNPADIDDIIQDTYLRLLGHTIVDPKSFMMAIARRLAIDLWRNQARDQIMVHNHTLLSEIPDSRTDPERILIAWQELEEIAAFVRDLPESQRLAFVLIEILGYEYAEAGHFLNNAVHTLEVKMNSVKHRGWDGFRARRRNNK